MHAGAAVAGALCGESGDAGGVVARAEGVVAEHRVEPGDGGALGVVDGEPGWIADDVEAGVRALPLLGESGGQEAVDLDAPVELLAEVLPAGVGDAYAEESLSMTRAPGRCTVRMEEVGCQGSPCGAEVVEEAGLGEGADLGAVDQVGGLPGWTGTATVPGGVFSPSVCGPAVPLRWPGRLRSRAESVAASERSTANQCSGKEPWSSGE